MPGMNDYISVRLQDGEKKTKIQKRLLLLNIDELFFKFKEYSLNKLCMKCCSKSKFYELRPKHVIEVGAAGTHNVCVCETHQNIKLMLGATHAKTEKYYLMNLIVCDVHNYECMLKRCVNCPGTNPLLEYLMTAIPNDSIIKFKKWESIDCTMLHNMELPSNEFVKLLVAKIDKLTSHHFISKSQSRFGRELKANLSLNQCLLQGFFSQNYSMLSQDSTQSSFVPPQCTLHTFIAYINVDGKIISHSMCVFSNDMNHNTVVVHTFLKHVIKQIFLICPTLQKIIHFTEGAASQYKKFKNFSNLLCHLEDFKVAGE